MNLGKTLYVTNRKDWRLWLQNNWDKEKEIWLIYYKKASGKPRIPYNDSVEEALCYGWIDSTVKSIDKDRYAQRFSPRRAKSSLSEMNKERIRRLIKEKRMTPIGLKAVAHAFEPAKNENNSVASDIIKALKATKTVWENFQKLPEGYKKIRIAYIERGRTRNKEEFKKRLEYFVKMTEKNKKFGMVR